MSLATKVKVRPYICGVYLCFSTSFTTSTSFQNFYDTDLLEADVVSLYATLSKVSFTETKTSTRAGEQYKQNISISLPIGDELRSEHITRIHQAEQVVLKLTNGEYLFLGRNDAQQNTKPKVSYTGDAQTARFEFVNMSIAPSGYTDIHSIGEIPDNFLFVLLENGKTIRYLGDNPGDTGLAFGDDSGISYKAVSTLMFYALDPQFDNYTNKCTTLVTNMAFTFQNTSFNENISHFDTAQVTNMRQMFLGNNVFNQDIGDWDVSKVQIFFNMFRSCFEFNQDIGNWDVSSAKDMGSMFHNCNKFNQDISNWNVSNVINMDLIFYRCLKFNQPLNNWDVSNVTSMALFFWECINFNQPLNNWDVSNVTNMDRLFGKCFSFNQPLNNWNVSNVLNMSGMFREAYNFDQEISNWCVENFLTAPPFFDFSTSPSWTEIKKPNWGTPCN